MSLPELTLAAQLESAGIGFLREVRFMEGRRFRADFVILSMPRVMVEIDGGAWTGGRHTRGKGFAADCEKQNLAVIAGFRVLRVTPDQVADGRALSWIRQALNIEENVA